MGKVGKKSIQNGRCKVHQNQVQTTPRLILPVEIGTNRKVQTLSCDRQQEEPILKFGRFCEVGVSRIPSQRHGTVLPKKVRDRLWEGGGETPLPHPIVRHFRAEHAKLNL